VVASYTCGCIILHNFCMGAYMDRPADAVFLGRSHKTAEWRLSGRLKPVNFLYSCITWPPKLREASDVRGFPKTRGKLARRVISLVLTRSLSEEEVSLVSLIAKNKGL
jgi:hypothetical protein